MSFVLTVDQIQSRRQGDLITEAIAQLSNVETALGFVRTVGDEFQGLLDDPMSVATAILSLMRTSSWHIGVGIGPVETPLPADTRSARGAAFVTARIAVERAKQEPSHVSVVAAPPAEQDGHDAEAVLRLIAALWDRRSKPGWDAVDLVRKGLTISEAADQLNITRQAVGQRLQAAHWTVERDAVPVLARLLARADQVATADVDS